MEELFWRTGDEITYIDSRLVAEEGGKPPTKKQRIKFLTDYLHAAEQRTNWTAEHEFTEPIKVGMIWEDRVVHCTTDIDKQHVLAHVRMELEKLK